MISSCSVFGLDLLGWFFKILFQLCLTRQDRLRTDSKFTTAAWQKTEPLEGEGKRGYKTRQIKTKQNKQNDINTTLSKHINKDISKTQLKYTDKNIGQPKRHDGLVLCMTGARSVQQFLAVFCWMELLGLCFLYNFEDSIVYFVVCLYTSCSSVPLHPHYPDGLHLSLVYLLSPMCISVCIPHGVSLSVTQSGSISLLCVLFQCF